MNAANKTNRVLGMVNRQFRDLDKASFLIYCIKDLSDGFQTTLGVCYPGLVTIPKERHRIFREGKEKSYVRS